MTSKDKFKRKPNSKSGNVAHSCINHILNENDEEFSCE